MGARLPVRMRAHRSMAVMMVLLALCSKYEYTDADPSEQLQRDLNAAIAAGRSTFAISPGVYRPKRDLLLNNARNLNIVPSEK